MHNHLNTLNFLNAHFNSFVSTISPTAVIRSQSHFAIEIRVYFVFFLLLLWHHFLLFMYRFFSFSFQVYFEWKHKRFTSYYELYFFNYKTISPFNNFTMILKCESKLYHNQIRNERKKIVCLCMSVMCLCASAEEKIILGRFNLLMI